MSPPHSAMIEPRGRATIGQYGDDDVLDNLELHRWAAVKIRRITAHRGDPLIVLKAPGAGFVARRTLGL